MTLLGYYPDIGALPVSPAMHHDVRHDAPAYIVGVGFLCPNHEILSTSQIHPQIRPLEAPLTCRWQFGGPPAWRGLSGCRFSGQR
jgi:hypothetical protein